jgi:hypothetical protein
MWNLHARLQVDPRMDIFLWHYSIDLIESDSNLYALGLVLMLGVLLAIAWREVLLADKGASGGS